MSTATFLKSDATTNGTWYSGTVSSHTFVYGSDGFGLPDPNNRFGSNNPKWPAYATITLGGDTLVEWAFGSSNVRAVEYPPPGTSTGSDSQRIASAWFANTSFTVDIQDGSLHQIALYFLDWDGFGGGRNEQIQITDDNNGNAVLDTRSVSGFEAAGKWLVWTVSGKVTFTITNLNSSSNAVLSGIFFDPAPATPAVFPPFVSRPRFEPALYE